MSYTEVMILCSQAEEVEKTPIEKYLPLVVNKDHYPIIDSLNAWVLERHGLPPFTEWGFALTQQEFDSELVPELVGNISKELMFFGAWHFLDRKEFVAVLRTLPWKAPAKVWVLFSSEHNSCYSGGELFSTTNKPLD